MLHYISIMLTKPTKRRERNKYFFLAKIGKGQTEGGNNPLWRAKWLGDYREKRGVGEKRGGQIFLYKV